MRMLVVFIVLISSPVFGQIDYPETVIPIQQKHVLFGMDFGFNFSKLNIKESVSESPSLIFGDTLREIKQFNAPGVFWSLFMTYPWRIVTIRPAISLNFYRNNLSYELSSNVIDKQLTTLTFGFSFHALTYLNKKRKGAYLITGLVYEKVKAFWNNITPSENYMSGEIGIGIAPFFTMDNELLIAPEIKYSFGFSDVNEPSGTPYDNVISSLKRNTLKISMLIYF